MSEDKKGIDPSFTEVALGYLMSKGMVNEQQKKKRRGGYKCSRFRITSLMNRCSERVKIHLPKLANVREAVDPQTAAVVELAEPSETLTVVPTPHLPISVSQQLEHGVAAVQDHREESMSLDERIKVSVKQSEYAGDDYDGKKRGGYRCGVCGAPKKGHRCKYPGGAGYKPEPGSGPGAILADPLALNLPDQFTNPADGDITPIMGTPFGQASTSLPLPAQPSDALEDAAVADLASLVREEEGARGTAEEHNSRGHISFELQPLDDIDFASAVGAAAASRTRKRKLEPSDSYLPSVEETVEAFAKEPEGAVNVKGE